MKLRRPREYELVLEPVTDLQTAIAAMTLATLKATPTTLRNIERTALVAAFEPLLESGGAQLAWDGFTVTVSRPERRPFRLLQPLPAHEHWCYALVLAATQIGSEIVVPNEFDETLQNIVLALRRMGAELEFTHADQPRLVVHKAIDRGIKYHFKRESAKIAAPVIVAAAALSTESEFNDLFESNRLDYLFESLISRYRREDLTKSKVDDELERRLQRRQPKVSEFKSRVVVPGGLSPDAAEISLRPDAELAAYLAAAALNHPKGKLVLQRVHVDDLTSTPLSQLRRMGADIQSQKGSGGSDLTVSRSEVKSRSIHYDQLHDYPDAIGALALANARTDGTAVVRSSPFNTQREESRRNRICAAMRALGVKVAEISDGVVIEGRSELSGQIIDTGGDPICELMALAAVLGPVREVEVDSVAGGKARWGENFSRALNLVAASE